MTKSLVIVESPAKANTINKYLGDDFVVKASLGHVKDLPKSKLGVDVEHGRSCLSNSWLRVVTAMAGQGFTYSVFKLSLRSSTLLGSSFQWPRR